MTPKKEYDMALRNRAVTGLMLRGLVAAYIVYLAWMILSGTLKGGSPIPAWGAWLISIVLASAALAFCAFAWKGFRKALKAAEISG